MRAIACPRRGTFILFLILCVCLWGGSLASALAQQSEPAYGSLALVHSDDHPALNSSVKSITVKGYDQNGKIVYARTGLEPAAILTLEEVPLNCVALNIFYFDATNPSPVHMAKVGVERDGPGLAVVTDPETEDMNGCTTTAYIKAPAFQWKLDLTGSSRYSQLVPTVAMSNNNVVVIYDAQNRDGHQHWMAIVGRLAYGQSGGREITWGSPQSIWDMGDGRYVPNASLNENGWLVVVGNDDPGVVSSKVCKVKDDLSLSCAKEQHDIGWGYTPSISIDDSGRGVLMYASIDGIIDVILYRLVYINEDSKTLKVMGLQSHDTGIRPQVAINENGGVVEVHQTNNAQQLYFLWLNVGEISDSGIIHWGESERFETRGMRPVVALSDDGVIMEAHNPSSGTSTYYRYGQVDFNNKRVAWEGRGRTYVLQVFSELPALAVNGLYEVGAFVYSYGAPEIGYFGLGELRQQPLCPWPAVFTHEPYAVSNFEAKSGGEVVDQGAAPVTQRGVCWSLHPKPTIDNYLTTDGSGLGEFSSSVDGLDAGVHYYVRAYAVNSSGVGYGQQMKFKTGDPGSMGPTVTTNRSSQVGSTSAYTGGEVTKEGESRVKARGVCWSTSVEPTIHDSKTVDGSDLGRFTSILHGLKPETTYFARAYATNSFATTYGEETVITTEPAIPMPPEVLTTAASGITLNTASSGGFVVETGGHKISARGVCWSTSPNPTIHDGKTTQSGQSGRFTSKITGLEPGKTYHYRAYATNQYGTGYGQDRTFTTKNAGLQNAAKSSPTQITHDAAVSREYVANVGSGGLTTRGICRSSNPGPTIPKM